jgi:uncharacterized protein YecT (DUF1311 family)
MKWLTMIIMGSIFHYASAMDNTEENCAGIKGSDNPQCEQKLYQQSDQALNNVYKKIIGNAKLKSALTSGQRAWIFYRDTHCGAVDSLQKKSRAVCLMEVTDRRIQTLQKTYQMQDSTTINEGAPDFKEIDTQLNGYYKGIINKLAPVQAQSLREAQRAWLAFRDSDCAAQQKVGIKNQACLGIHTQNRLNELQAIYGEENAQKTVTTKAVTSHKQPAIIGSWQGIGGEAAVQLNFGMKEGIHFYSSTLEKLPFEAGQWQIQNNGELQITNSDGRVLHRYVKFVINDQTLSLHETDGARLDYQRINN